MQEITVKGPQATFRLCLSHKFNVILGDSGEKKTYLCSLIESKAPTIKRSHENMFVIDDKTWYQVQQQNREEMIYFADESFSLLHSVEFANFVKNNRSIFVVISREGFFRISYGISQIYKLYAGVGKVRTNIPAYDVEKYCQKSEVDICLVEDEGSGYTFFADLLNIPVKSSQGKDQVTDFVRKSSEKVLLAIDNCGFGANADDLFKEIKLQNRISMIGYECFEEMILSAFGQSREPNEEILNLEEWYEQKLIEYTRNTTMDTYNKSTDYRCLSKCYQIVCKKKSDGECNFRNSAEEIFLKSAYQGAIDRKYLR